MFLLSLSTAIALVFVFAEASSLLNRHVLHERQQLSSEWKKLDPVGGDTILPIRIGLTQSNLEHGDDLLMRVSDPASEHYGKHYTAEEVIDLFAPSTVTVNSVQAWLNDAGIESNRISLSSNKQWMQFDASTQEAEMLLHTRFHSYEHLATAKRSIASEDYSVPKCVQEHIDYITPGVKLFTTHSVRSTGNDVEKRDFDWGKGRNPIKPPTKPLPISWAKMASLVSNNVETLYCDQFITPACIFALYNITTPILADPKNQLGIFEDLGDYYSQQDLDIFFNAIANDIPIGTHPELEGIDGGTAPTVVTNAGAESDLDIQISYPIIYPQGEVLFQTDDPVYEANYQFSGFLNTFLDALDGSYCRKSSSPLDPPYPDPAPGGYNASLQCGVYRPTNVISISYGGPEASLPVAYQRRQCHEFMKLGLQGVSVVLASGDSGVGGASSDGTNNACLGPNNDIFNPDFPATCPYITTVGATYLPPGNAVSTDEEVATTRFASGGGFSNIYRRAWYQQSAVATYLKKHSPSYPYYKGVSDKNMGANGGIYNRAGRAYPDVSAVGDNIVIVNKGVGVLIGGTSASAPVFAAILNRINEERLAAGRSTVGFVNPMLYRHPEVFHDITVGNNPGCNTTGFAASTGWDPVTGLGTPDYPALLKLFMGTS